MKDTRKSFIKRAVVAPIIIGAFVTVVYFIVLPLFSGILPLNDKELALADFQKTAESIYSADAQPATEGTLKKSDIVYEQGNVTVGTISVGDVVFPVAYDAERVTLTDTASIYNNNNYIGETGNSYVYGYRAVVFPNNYHIGDSVEVKLNYGSYSFEVKEIKTITGEHNVFSTNTNVSNGLVLYTNSNSGYGFGNSFDVIIMEMTSGPIVVD